jgi:hypothetical protein
MAWVKCVKCGFSQIPAQACLRCGEPLPPPKPRASRLSGAAVKQPPGAPATSGWTPAKLAGFGLAGFLVILLALFWLLRSRPADAPVAHQALSQPTPASLDLTGRWTFEIEKTLPGPPPRPAIKSAYIETSKEGEILAAGVLLTDPGRGGAGAGYRIAPDGKKRLEEAVAQLTGAKSAPVRVDFIPFPAWVPARQRQWRSLEAPNRHRGDPIRYMLLESVEDDYLVQAGINETGFLSYLFFSAAYGRTRGVDALSRVIHPEPGSSLRGFQNLVWDFSGSADFLKLEVNASLSGPDGQMDRFKLKR